MTKIAVIGVMAILLSGCLEVSYEHLIKQEEKLAACLIDQSAADPSDRDKRYMGKLVEACMDREGYDFNIAYRDCNETAGPSQFQVACYRPSGRFESLEVELDLAFRRDLEKL